MPFRLGPRSRASLATTPRALLALATLALPAAREPAAQEQVPAAFARCASYSDVQITTTADLACMELFATPRGGAARGRVELARVPAPFGVAVNADGNHRVRLRLWLESLPPVESLAARAYVAWVTPPRLEPVVRLGTVANGLAELGEVELNRFSVWVTAEEDPDTEVRRGPLILRGDSPSSRMHPEDLLTRSPMALLGAPEATPAAEDSRHGGHTMPGDGWAMPPMHPAVPMMPGMSSLRPVVSPFLPAADIDSLPPARPRQLLRLTDGATLDLEAGAVRREVGGRAYVMYAFNGQIPGPLIQVPEKSTLFVNFTNRTALPTAVHWHGVRLDNRFDGVPGVTQDPVAPGETFRYQIYFRDAGIYWYHPHHREDIAQDLGLYGNMLVEPEPAGYWSEVNRERVLMLDDLLVGEAGLVPYGLESANYMLMGRFGNVMLVNGETDLELEARPGEVARFFLTNVSNTRTFNLSFRHQGRPLPVKVVGADISRFEREERVQSVVIAPAERYVVEVRFPAAGEVRLVNAIQAINHRLGAFFPEVHTLASIRVVGEPFHADLAPAFETLRENLELQAEIRGFRQHFDREPDHELTLSLDVGELPLVVDQLMALDRVYFNPVEWSGTMPMMNWISSAEHVQWNLIDARSGRRNMEIEWRFRVGDVARIRINNDRAAFHAMQHPVHFHGQRFLVLSVDGVPNENLAWKDTVLIPVGATVELLLELSNPGRWMTHCHIAEHLESGMKMVFVVE